MMTTQELDDFEGWPLYPQNLGLSPLEVDANGSDKRISSNSDRLFAGPDDINLGFLDLGPIEPDAGRDVEYGTVASAAQLSGCFRRKFSSRVFFLRQNYSWGQLCISEELLRKLFTCLRVHPDFVEVLMIFGEKLGPVEESFSTFFSHCHPQQGADPFSNAMCSYDMGYNIKYVARHSRAYPKDPFSVRETGVYHSFDAVTQETSWIFIQASGSLENRMQKCFTRGDDTNPLIQFKLHAVVLQAVSEGWREYLVYLEDRFAEMVDRGFYTNVKGPKLEGDIDVDFSDIRKLQILIDKVKRIQHILQLNFEISHGIKSAIKSIKRVSVSSLAEDFEGVESKIDLFMTQHRIHISRLQSLIDRGQGIRAFIQHILDFKAAEHSKGVNASMKELAEQGVQENRLIKSLTFQTTEDTKSMRLIALVSAIFLPATFLASLFGTNFFGFQGGELEMASNFWIYIVGVVILCGLSVVLWFWWRHRSRLRSEQDVEALSEKTLSPA